VAFFWFLGIYQCRCWHERRSLSLYFWHLVSLQHQDAVKVRMTLQRSFAMYVGPNAE
jgi:hypothetical protein